jgi:hypothetical protein
VVASFLIDEECAASADGCVDQGLRETFLRMLRLSGSNPATWGFDMNLMKSYFLGSTVGLVFLSTVLLVAVPPNLAHAQGDEGQGRGHGHAIAQNGDAQTEAKPQTWPQFKATTSTPLLSLYDALGRPDNLTISGSIRSHGEGLVNPVRPAPAARDDYLASLRWSSRASKVVWVAGDIVEGRAHG